MFVYEKVSISEYLPSLKLLTYVYVPSDTAGVVHIEGERYRKIEVQSQVIIIHKRWEYLDKILVPSGLAIMITYHVILLHRCLNLHPEATATGYENHCRRVWVERVLQVEGKDRGMYLAAISSTISAATFYCSTSLIMSSIVGTWLGASSHNIFLMSITNVYGDKSFGLILVKYFSILTCFLVAFASFLLCVRSFVHAAFLLSMPSSQVPADFIQRAVVRGSALWAVGFRAIRFAAPLLLWIFGPIPMFVFSLVIVLFFSFVDANSTPLDLFRRATEDGQPI